MYKMLFFIIPGGRFELPSFMYEINILPLNYPGLFILFINPTLESIIYYLSKILFKNDLEY